jgi:ATP-binding cassette subfamily B protein
MAFFYNKKLSIIIIIVIPILAIILMFIIKKSYKRFNKMQKSLDKLNNITQENLTNIRVVKSFVRENFEKDKFEKSNEELKEKTISAMNIAIFTMPVMTLFMNVTTLLVMFFGGKMVIANSMSVGELTAFINYILQILMSLMMLSMVILNSSKTFSSLNRVKEVMDRESSISDKDAMYKELHVKDGKIEFENVYFKYFENSEDVLKNISFTIEKGENIGIIGSTGSGKTSLISLITRLYEPYSGEIRIDGINIKDYSFKNLRNKIAVVLQNNTLFSGTIEENIRWGVEDASENDIFDAAINAQADGFIRSFKDGYKTVLEQGGANLSGGQKQRICIARALIKKPRILILDDSTSAVDTATEGKIKNSLNKIYKDTTKIIIAQRISSVFDCSKIIVLDEGEIVGIGNHNYLMENNNEYREIYYSQMEIKK